MNISHNPVLSILDIGNTARAGFDSKIFKHTEENTEIVNKLEILKNVISQLRKDEAEGKKHDYSQDEKTRELLKKAREIAPDIIGQKDSWSREENQAKLENLRTEVTHLTSQLNLPMMLMTQLYQERNRIDEIVAEIVKMYREEMRHFVQNQIAR